MLYRLALVALVVFAFVPTPAQAQLGGQLIGPQTLRKQGLERLWFAQLSMDSARGQVAGIHQFISSTKLQTVYEILHDGRRYVFSERDRNAFGDMIGPEGAKLEAEKKLAQIQGELVAAGKPATDAPAIQMRIVPEITLYVTSERGTVHAIDAETGRTRWSTMVGNSNYFTTEASANDEYVAVVNGSTLYVLKASDGAIVWNRTVSGVPGAGPAVSEARVFVPMISGAVESFQLDDPRKPSAMVKSFGRAMVQPVISANSVAWPTDQGKLYVGFANEPSMRFRIESRDRIEAAPSFLPPDKVLAASLDGTVYCIYEGKGNILWRFTTGAPISVTPVGLGDAVYAITDRGALFCLSANDGRERWMTSGIRGFLAGNDERIYCTDAAGDIAVIDVKTGSRLGTVMASGSDLRLSNQQTDRIILGSSNGLLQCLHESRLHWPRVNAAIDPKRAQQAKAKADAPPPAAAPPAGPVADPFAAPGAVDPFAAPAAGAAPAKAAPPAAAPDPFAPAPAAGAPPAAAPDPFAP